MSSLHTRWEAQFTWRQRPPRSLLVRAFRRLLGHEH
jgi:hypothetical protein